MFGYTALDHGPDTARFKNIARGWTMPLSPLTVVQDRNVGDVALVCLVLRSNRRKLDIPRVEDGGQSAVNTAQLLQKL